MKRFSLGIIIGLLVGLLVGTAAFAVADNPIKLIINGKEITCDVSPQVINGRTMVSARYVAEALGATVAWDADKNAVVVTGKDYTPQQVSENQSEQIYRLINKGDTTYELWHDGKTKCAHCLITVNNISDKYQHLPKVTAIHNVPDDGKTRTTSIANSKEIYEKFSGSYIPSGSTVTLDCAFVLPVEYEVSDWKIAQ